MNTLEVYGRAPASCFNKYGSKYMGSLIESITIGNTTGAAESCTKLTMLGSYHMTATQAASKLMKGMDNPKIKETVDDYCGYNQLNPETGRYELVENKELLITGDNPEFVYELI